MTHRWYEHPFSHGQGMPVSCKSSEPATAWVSCLLGNSSAGAFRALPFEKGEHELPPSPDFDLACPRFFPIAQRTVYDVKTQEVAEFHPLLLPATFRLCWRALPECPIQQSVIDDDGNQQRLKQATWFHLDDNFCGPTEQVYWAPLSRHSLRVPLFCMPPKTSARLTRSRSARG